MSWNRLRNPVVNFVNLGRLYSLPQGQKAFNHQRIPYFARSPSQPKPFYGGVNMGGLYRRDYPSPFLEPRGWAYLEDGSVFIARETYSHHDLQQILRIVDYYVRNPTDEMRALQMDRTDDRQTQMVLLEQGSSGPVLDTQYLYIYGRYCYAGENICAPSTPYAAARLALDSTRTSPLSIASPSGGANCKMVPTAEFLTIETTVRTVYLFRGTLIDGILQPNVHLGNGLSFTVGRGPDRQNKTPAPGEGREEQKDTRPRRYSPQRVLRGNLKQTTLPQHIDIAEYGSKFAQHIEGGRALTLRENKPHRKTKAQQLKQTLSEAKSHHTKKFVQHEHELVDIRPKVMDRLPQPAQQVDDVSTKTTTLQPSLTKRRKNHPGSRAGRTQKERQKVEAAQAKSIVKSFNPEDPVPTDALKPSTHDRKAAEAEAIFEFLKQDDTMPMDALEVLRKAKPKR